MRKIIVLYVDFNTCTRSMRIAHTHSLLLFQNISLYSMFCVCVVYILKVWMNLRFLYLSFQTHLQQNKKKKICTMLYYNRYLYLYTTHMLNYVHKSIILNIHFVPYDYFQFDYIISRKRKKIKEQHSFWCPYNNKITIKLYAHLVRAKHVKGLSLCRQA